ncbi:hypothetical protein B0H13DRAFT_1861627 [Mycena leptocephala]|nr:hypothetical protein B0H13DRAFT_1861627 [Mycena leptocephala]
METERFCGPCNRTISFGQGDEANWSEHEKSLKHQRNVRAAAGTSSIKSFFAPKPKISHPPPASGSSSTGATPLSSNVSAAVLSPPTVPPPSVSHIIDVDSMPDPRSKKSPYIAWKYNLKPHIQTVHPSAKIANYKSFYDLADGEEIELERISKKKKRKSSKKKINFRILPEHSTEAALGDFSKAWRTDSEHEDDADEESSSSSRSPSPDPTREMGAESALRALSPDEDLPLASTLLGTPQHHTSCNESTVLSAEPASSLTSSDTLLTEITAPSASDSNLNNPGGSDGITQLDVAQKELVGEATSFTRRSRRASAKRRIILSDDEGEEGCSAPDCTITENEPMVMCSGPAFVVRSNILFQAHLCCVGLKTMPVEWYCDDNCVENAGGRVRKKRRT